MNAARHEPKDLGPLFQPRSVAIVGCSPIESGKLGSWPLRNLLIQQSKVAIYPVNPKYREIEALRSYPSLDALPEPPDVVLVMLPAEQSLAALAEADRIGARAAIVFGAGFGETEAGKALERELAALAAKTRMPICGPNTDGIINVIDGIPCGFPPYAAITPRPVGDVAVVSQSGALVSSLVMRLQRHKLGLTFSCAIGNAIDVGLADYVAHLADEPRTSSILVYVEGVGDAPAFVAAAQRAIAAGKLVAVMKGGRSDVGSAAVRSHTGSMVGAYEAFAALCHAHGIVTADSFEQLAALPLLAPVARHVDPSHARRVGVLSGSGAISSHLVDKATEHGFEVPELAPETTSRLRKRFTFTEPRNPIDLTGQVVHDPQLHVDVLDALGADPGIGIVLAGLLYGPVDITDRMKRELVEAARTTPIVAYSAEGADARDEPILASGGVPIVASADLLLSSLDKLLVAGASRRAASGGERDEVRRRAALTLLGAQTSGDAVPPETAWALLDLYDVQRVRNVAVASADEAAAAAVSFGGPVAMKVDSEHVAHKSDLGLVALDRRGDQQVRAAWAEIATRAAGLGLGELPIVVQQMAPEGVEVLVGAMVDHEAGPVVAIGSGGLLTEVLADRALLPAPVSDGEVRAALATLRVNQLLRGARGRPPADVDALVRVVVALSQLIAELADTVREIEINPVIVSTSGAVAVDVLAARATSQPID